MTRLGNGQIPNAHYSKGYLTHVKTWFNQPMRKKRRRRTRVIKARKIAPKPVGGLLRPIVRCPTFKYHTKIRAGRGFSLAELKVISLFKCPFASCHSYLALSEWPKCLSPLQLAKILNIDAKLQTRADLGQRELTCLKSTTDCNLSNHSSNQCVLLFNSLQESPRSMHVPSVSLWTTDAGTCQLRAYKQMCSALRNTSLGWSSSHESQASLRRATVRYVFVSNYLECFLCILTSC